MKKLHLSIDQFSALNHFQFRSTSRDNQFQKFAHNCQKKNYPSKMSNEIPQWLNEKFFEKVLRASQGDKNLTVWNFFVRSLKKELMSLDLNF